MHIGPFHLLANSISLLIFGGIVERSYGWRAFLAIYLTAGVAGNVASYAAGPTVGAGASGAIFGMLGAFAIYLYFNRAMLGSGARGSLGGLAFIIAINISFGLTTTGVDNWAHLGGLIAGVLLALRLAPRTVTENPYGLNRRLLLAQPFAPQHTPATTAATTTPHTTKPVSPISGRHHPVNHISPVVDRPCTNLSSLPPPALSRRR